jgi:hypothetical protein
MITQFEHPAVAIARSTWWSPSKGAEDEAHDNIVFYFCADEL